MTTTLYFKHNPHRHLTMSFRLTAEEWEKVKVILTENELRSIELGGWAERGDTSWWKQVQS